MPETVTTPLDREAKAREVFEHDTAKHELTVLRDDGVYRHLRFKAPGSIFYWHDLVTWPGHLVICGDAGDYHFARVTDMFEFFAGERVPPDRINPQYWAEKLQGSDRARGQRYSEEAYARRVNQWLEYKIRDDDLEALAAEELRAAVKQRLLVDELYGYPPTDESNAFRLLHEFEHDGITVYDPSEWDLREFDGRFLWCCWAIVRGIQRYREHQAEGGDRG